MAGDPALQGAAGAAAGKVPAAADPIDQAIDSFFGDGPDSQAAAMDPGGAGAGGLPITSDANGQAAVMTNQGALPLFMSDQGPMAMTQGGPVPLQALAQSGALDSFQQAPPAPPAAPEVQAKAAQAAKVAVEVVTQVAAAAVKTLASALSAPAARSGARAPAPATLSAPAQFSGRSAFVPARPAAPAPAPAPVRSAPVSTLRAAPQADVFQNMGGGAKPATDKEAPTNHKVADPKLDKDGGGGTRIGTVATGDGN